MATTTNFNWETPDDTDLVKDGAAAIRTALNGVDTSFVDLKGGTTGQVLSKASGTDLDFTWVAQDDSNAIQNAIVDAKGDLIVGASADTPARLAVGTNGYVLTANSGATNGVEWASVSGGDVIRIATTSFSGSSAVNLNDIFSSTYKNYMVMFQITSASGTGNLQARMRVSGADNTTSNYYAVYDYIASSSATAGSTKTAGQTQYQFTFISDAQMAIPFTVSNPYESTQTFIAAPDFFAGDGYKVNTAGWFNGSTSFTGMSFFPTTGTITGEVTVYGLKRA